jgi:hypothetical protein
VVVAAAKTDLALIAFRRHAPVVVAVAVLALPLLGVAETTTTGGRASGYQGHHRWPLLLLVVAQPSAAT